MLFWQLQLVQLITIYQWVTGCDVLSVQHNNNKRIYYVLSPLQLLIITFPSFFCLLQVLSLFGHLHSQP